MAWSDDCNNVFFNLAYSPIAQSLELMSSIQLEYNSYELTFCPGNKIYSLAFYDISGGVQEVAVNLGANSHIVIYMYLIGALHQTCMCTCKLTSYL